MITGTKRTAVHRKCAFRSKLPALFRVDLLQLPWPVSGQEVEVKKALLVSGLGLYVALGAASALAGVPLKGVDVKLGKNPGGGSVQRTSDASGTADFGVLPKGSYVLTFSVANVTGAKTPTLHLEIRGTAEGTVTHVLPAATADIIVPVLVTSDGKTPLTVKVSDGTGEVVDRACCKSHSNTNNN